MSRIYINNDWKFSEDFFKLDSEDVKFVRLPHTCKELPYNYFSEEEYQMVCGYERKIDVPKEWEGKRVFLTIEGAAHYAEVFLNGVKCGEHNSGYTAFTIELTQHLLYEETNVVKIKLDTRERLNTPPFGFVIDYMTYGGIYRDVYLDIKDETFIEDVFVKPTMDGNVESEVIVRGTWNDSMEVKQWIYLNKQKVLLSENKIGSEVILLRGYVEGVELWNLDNPMLYHVETQLFCNGQIVDSHEVKIGFRSAEFRADGFYLNGRKVKIRGLNRHQSYPYVGYAMPKSMQEYDADILKYELGCNAVRTSHYPQSQHFINRCDEIGLLVFTEIPGWQHIGDEEWKNQAVKNVEEMVLQYRNHPSIIMWGVRINESADDEAFYVRTNDVAHKLDSTRQTGGVRCIKKSQLLEDVYTYNDFIHDGKAPGCDLKQKVTSEMNKPYLISEYNGHMYPTKSFDDESHRVEHALRHARVLDSVASQDNICGSFGWCMADYNTHKDFGSGDRICYHGVLDMFRNHKMAANVYASQQQENIILEVGSSMDIGEHPASCRGEVWIFTNADTVRMYKNDTFIKEYVPKHAKYPHLRKSPVLIDDYIGTSIWQNENFKERQAKLLTDALNYIALYGYTQLPLNVMWAAVQCMVFYHMKMEDIVNLYTKYVGDWGATSTEYRFEAIQNGKVVKTVVKTPMKKAKLQVQMSKEILKEGNSYDVSAVRMQAVDEHGNILYYCNEPVEIIAEGPVEVIGPKIVSLKGGMAGTYIRTTGICGEAVLRFVNSQMDETKIFIKVEKESL